MPIFSMKRTLNPVLLVGPEIVVGVAGLFRLKDWGSTKNQ